MPKPKKPSSPPSPRPRRGRPPAVGPAFPPVHPMPNPTGTVLPTRDRQPPRREE